MADWYDSYIAQIGSSAPAHVACPTCFRTIVTGSLPKKGG